MVSSFTLKQKLARLMRLPLLHRLMLEGMKLLVPRHRIGVSLVALDEQERVFFLKHVFHPNVPWGLPGGWLGPNEDPATGLIRELREETGLTAVIGPVVHTSLEPRPNHIGIAYLGHIQPGPLKLCPEILEAAWFPTDALPMPQYAFTQQALQTAVHIQRSRAWQA